jgi:hypothetical protein
MFNIQNGCPWHTYFIFLAGANLIKLFGAYLRVPNTNNLIELSA